MAAYSGTARGDLIYGYDPANVTLTGLVAEQVASGLDQPVGVATPPGDFQHLFIVERTGQIQVLNLDSGQLSSEPLLNLSGDITTTGEQGLMGLAFHPLYADNGQFYVSLTNAGGDSEIRGYQVFEGEVDPASEQSILAIDQPAFTNHKGGWIDFGLDGYLYAGFGDGGGEGDPGANAQDPDSLLGKILRIDVNGDDFPTDPARNYAIPTDNPLGGEVFALGLRNPWQAGFDSATGDLYAGDVGARNWEEINLIRPGGNYGWPAFEGPSAFSNTATSGPATAPLYAYDHDLGEAVIGGTVYRGPLEAMQGQYVFADFLSGRVWTLAGGQATERTDLIDTDFGTIDRPSAFGEDARFHLYLTDYDGDVFRLLPQGSASAAEDTIDGLDGGDILFGGGGADLLTGGGGVDRLVGQGGDDRLIGGAGNDVLDGGAGADEFMIHPGGGTDTIVGFEDGDLIVIDGPGDAQQLLDIAQPAGDGTLIALGATDGILLPGLDPSQLLASDFAFV